MTTTGSLHKNAFTTHLEGFDAFLKSYRETLHHLFTVRSDLDGLSLRRGLPPFVLREVTSCNPLSVVIPREHGGRGGGIEEFLAVLAASSYESLALSLMIGINGGLFLQPLARYGSDEIKGRIFEQFVEQGAMGGLMITEPDHGSDALSMQTAFVEKDDHFHVRGLKHWAGLTGWADYWLVAGRRRDSEGRLARDIDFFVCDMKEPDQRIEVEEVYNNLGLYMIPYGRNRIDARVPKSHRLEPETSGIKMMLDTLYRSRLQFPGMGMGFLNRMLDEAMAHTRERSIGGKTLFQYDQVQQRLARIQASYTVCSAMCTYSSENADADQNDATAGIMSNSLKAVVTDYMHDAAQSLLQLMGAKGYRIDHIAGRSVVDSRPFQIFEGSNDILYQQISESVLKSMRRLSESNLYRHLTASSFASRAADYFKDLLDFKVDLQMPQRRLVELGKMLGRIISMEMTIELGERGFRSDLIGSALTSLREEVAGMLCSYRNSKFASLIEDYSSDSSWLNFVRPQPEG